LVGDSPSEPLLSLGQKRKGNGAEQTREDERVAELGEEAIEDDSTRLAQSGTCAPEPLELGAEAA
jgi:hypothetical protein